MCQVGGDPELWIEYEGRSPIPAYVGKGNDRFTALHRFCGEESGPLSTDTFRLADIVENLSEILRRDPIRWIQGVNCSLC